MTVEDGVAAFLRSVIHAISSSQLVIFAFEPSGLSLQMGHCAKSLMYGLLLQDATSTTLRVSNRSTGLLADFIHAREWEQAGNPAAEKQLD